MARDLHKPAPGHSETGLRGLTAVAGAGGDALLAAVEGNAARVIRIDPTSGGEATELDLEEFLPQVWGMRVGYVIAGYNDMTKAGGSVLLGLEAFVPRNAVISAGHRLVDIGRGQVEGGGWFLIRRPDAHYDLRQVVAGFSQPLVAVRTIRVSPFPNDADAIYLGGYDANKAPAHNTAWVARANLAAALRASP